MASRSGDPAPHRLGAGVSDSWPGWRERGAGAGGADTENTEGRAVKCWVRSGAGRGGWQGSMEAIRSGTGEQSSGPPAFHANAFQAFNLKGGCQEGRGGERAGSARLSPEIGSLHLPRRLARSLAPPRCSRPCFSRGKREGKKGAGRIWEGEGLGGGWGWGPGRPAPG